MGGGAGGPLSLRSVVVVRTPRNKITFIKQIRFLGKLGLKEAKDVAETPPPFVLMWADQDGLIVLETMKKQLGESDVFEVYDASEQDRPLIPRVINAEAVLGAAGSGCLAQSAAVVAVGGGTLLYLLG